jgi:hypothetical protein
MTAIQEEAVVMSVVMQIRGQEKYQKRSNGCQNRRAKL